ncbi:MAG: methyltransferase domain-containing protein [Methanomicrobiaceae archaeon]|nr:methyltransferase domain-containing protein [Methanomicrobiaceae archaeon]
MRLLFELSGEHPTLPFSELACVGEVIERRTQVAVADCPPGADTRRLALTHVVMEYLGSCTATRDGLVTLLGTLEVRTEKPFVARVKKVGQDRSGLSQLELERLIGSMIRGEVSLSRPKEEYRAIISDGRIYLGRVIHPIDRGAFAYRNPQRRPFFHPGVMLPIYARALVNISLVKQGGLLLDPFCGTGGMILEAELVGASVLGSDADQKMVRGSRQNLPDAELFCADACALPLRDGVIDAIVTDLPYGQSVRIMGELESLYRAALGEMRRVLKDGGRAVVVSHRDIGQIAGEHFTVRELHLQRVHRSLTRRIMILE